MNHDVDSNYNKLKNNVDMELEGEAITFNCGNKEPSPIDGKENCINNSTCNGENCDQKQNGPTKSVSPEPIKKRLSREQELYLELKDIAKEELLQAEGNEVSGDNNTQKESEDEDLDFLQVQIPVRRTTSLKPYRTTASEVNLEPVSPGRRKTVRFADSLGLDLASVKQIANPDEPPILPDSVRKTLEREQLDHRQEEEVAFWRLRFSQPITSCPDFFRKVQDRKVALESCSVNNRDLRVHGVIRVANIAFEKFVAVRYTTNGWLTFNDVRARYVENSNDGKTDRFYFYFNVPGHLGVRNRIEFAVQYCAGDQSYWDSNHGYNYTLECIHNLGYY